MSDYDGNSDNFDDNDNSAQYGSGYVDDILGGDFELNENTNNKSKEFLDLEECEDKVWLVKVPPFLADKWEEALEEGADLGKIRVYNQEVHPEGTNSHTRMVLSLPENFEGIPRDYTLSVVSDKVQNTYIFEEANNKVARKIEGTVVHDYIAAPFASDPQYRTILRKRAMEAGGKNRQIAIESQNRQLDYLKPMRGTAVAWGGLGKKPKVDLESKAAKLPDSELRSLLFKLFAEFRYWSLKGLQNRTQQPLTHLKSNLKDIAELIKKGAHHTLYQLKSEYRDKSQEGPEDEDPSLNPYNNVGGISPAPSEGSEGPNDDSDVQDSSEGDDFLEVDG